MLVQNSHLTAQCFSTHLPLLKRWSQISWSQFCVWRDTTLSDVSIANSCQKEQEESVGAILFPACFWVWKPTHTYPYPIMAPGVYCTTLCISPWILLHSALKSSLKTAKRLQLDWTKTARDWTCSLGLSVLRLEDPKKTSCGGLVLLVETGLLYSYNSPSKRI